MSCINGITVTKYDLASESVLTGLSLALCAIAGTLCITILWLLLRITGIPSPLSSTSMMMFLALSDISLCVFSITASSIHEVTCHGWFCRLQSIANQYFLFSSFLWTFAMSNSSYKTVMNLFLHANTNASSSIRDRRLSGSGHKYTPTLRRNCFGITMPSSINSMLSPSSNGTKIMFRYHIISWGLPAVTVIIMLLTRSTGYSGHVCWLITVAGNAKVSSNHSQESILPLWVAACLFWAPLSVVEGFNIYVFYFLVKTLRNIPYSQALLIRFSRSLTILILCKSVILFSRTVLLFFPSHSIFVLSIIEVVSYPLQALGDFLILYDTYRENYKEGDRDTRIHSSRDILKIEGDVDEEDIDPEGYHVLSGLSGHSMHSQMSEDPLIRGLNMMESNDETEEPPELPHHIATSQHTIDDEDQSTSNILHVNS